MKRTEILILCVSVLVAGLPAGVASADLVFGPPMPLDEPVNSTGVEYFDCISADGLEMYLERPIPSDDILSLDWDLYVSTRETTNDPWSVPVNLGPIVNRSGRIDGLASLSSDGLQLYFSSNRGGVGRQEIWVAARESKDADWGTPVNLGLPLNVPGAAISPWITADGLELYFGSGRPGGVANIDVWVSHRASTDAPWGMPVNLGPVVNSTVDDSYPCVSPDGLVLFFSDGDNPSFLYRSGGYGQTDMWMSRRGSVSAPWELPANLGPGMNTSHLDSQPRISPDGSVLYFTSSRAGGIGGLSDIWQAPLIPTVDFNGDGKVDLTDLVLLIDNWGTDNALCDIGPYAWGDRKVDMEDLKVFMTYYEKTNPPKANGGK